MPDIPGVSIFSFEDRVLIIPNSRIIGQNTGHGYFMFEMLTKPDDEALGRQVMAQSALSYTKAGTMNELILPEQVLGAKTAGRLVKHGGHCVVQMLDNNEIEIQAYKGWGIQMFFAEKSDPCVQVTADDFPAIGAAVRKTLGWAAEERAIKQARKEARMARKALKAVLPDQI